jgi:plastocyanin
MTVDLPEQLGNERRVFHVKGEKTLEFYATQEADLAALKLTDLRLTLPETRVVLSRPGQYWTEPIDIQGLTIGPDAIDLEDSEGFVDLDTGYFTLQFRIYLTPEILPLMEEYVIEEMPLLVQEAGKLDLGKGSEYQSWLHFGIAPEYTGEFRHRSGGGWKNSCSTGTMICATVDDDSPCESPDTVYICPGEEVHLWWNSSEDVNHAEITPDVGSVSPSGHTVVRPTSTTKYTITVRGECKRNASVHVHVIREGEEIEITARPQPEYECWRFIAPEERYSRHIKITSIKPICGPGCFIHQPPITRYMYLDCGEGLMCNGQWLGRKEDDGRPHYFNTGLLRSNLPDYPFAGTWRFWPLNGSYQIQGNAYFIVTAKC